MARTGTGLLAALLTALLLFALPAAADDTTPWQKTAQLQGRIIAATTTTNLQSTLLFGLDLKVEKDWHTYWRSPGDAGLPPQIKWDGSENVKDLRILFPYPERMTMLGMATYGYDGDIIFPFEVDVIDPAKPVTLNLKAAVLTCNQICVPNDMEFTLTLPPGDGEKNGHMDVLQKVMQRVPVAFEKAGYTLASSAIGADKKSIDLLVTSTTPFKDPSGIVETAIVLDFGEPRVTVSPDKTSALFSFPVPDINQTPKLQGGVALTLTVVDGDRMGETPFKLSGEISRAVPAPAAPATASLLLIIGLALIGGLILNLMPCVLPVLSIKVMGLIGHADAEQGVIRRSFITTSAGIIFSFLVLAGFALLLREAGLSAGWGVQFQEPMFIASLGIILVLFAANMFGLFEIALPAWISSRVSDAVYHPRMAGDFTTGAFATLLATPCTAPFLGTAVGFALAAPALELVAVFVALGIGMALPYLLIAAFPSFAKHLPRPGKWMFALRIVLGLALLLTVGWLLFVLGAQVPQVRNAVTAALAGLFLALIGLHYAKGIARTVAWIAIVSIGAAALVLASATHTPATTQATVVQEKLNWVPFDVQKIRQYVAGGNTVFVDVTATWCLTCLANKKFVLETDAVRQALEQPHIILMQADWTNPDARIASFLKQHGRYGIPFNIVYGPKKPEGLALPELLTNGVVIDALQQAGR